jgi:hypothetical protein
MAYLRRVQVEGRVQAAAILNLLGEAMNRRERSAPEAMIAMMGGL